MSMFSGCYISQVMCVSSFHEDKTARHQSGAFEGAFHDLVNGQATATNVPDDFPPDIPRLQCQAGKKSVTLSQVNTQLVLRFDKEDSKTFDQTFAIVEKNLRQFWQGVRKLKADADLSELGVVITVNQPSTDPPAVIAENLFKRYFHFEKLGNPVSTAFQVGFESSGLFKNVSISGYEIRAVELQPEPASGPVFVKPSQLPLQESGIEYKFDVNNRPTVLSGQLEAKSAGEDVILAIKSLMFEDTKNLIEWS